MELYSRQFASELCSAEAGTLYKAVSIIMLPAEQRLSQHCTEQYQSVQLPYSCKPAVRRQFQRIMRHRCTTTQGSGAKNACKSFDMYCPQRQGSWGQPITGPVQRGPPGKYILSVIRSADMLLVEAKSQVYLKTAVVEANSTNTRCFQAEKCHAGGACPCLTRCTHLHGTTTCTPSCLNKH